MQETSDANDARHKRELLVRPLRHKSPISLRDFIDERIGYRPVRKRSRKKYPGSRTKRERNEKAQLQQLWCPQG